LHHALHLRGRKIQNLGSAQSLPSGVAVIVNPTFFAALTVVVLHKITLVAMFHFAHQGCQDQPIPTRGADPATADADPATADADQRQRHQQ